MQGTVLLEFQDWVFTSSWEDGEVFSGEDILALVLKDKYGLTKLMGGCQREKVEQGVTHEAIMCECFNGNWDGQAKCPISKGLSGQVKKKKIEHYVSQHSNESCVF